jgi:beta-N-acetylhexosaminidase
MGKAMKKFALALVASLLASCVAGTVPSRGSAAAAEPSGTLAPVGQVAVSPTFTQLIGQKLVVRMEGTTPSASLLYRIRHGQIGGVILFGSNITTATALRALTTKLQAEAKAGGQPPLLIATDQEGGSVKRIPWAPPTLSPPQMGALGSASTARSQGASTGNALHGLGINVDLAPVADVPTSTASFLYKQGRTWSFSATTTALLSDAFATGLESGRVVPSMKHFPGLGYARYNTDQYVDVILASPTMLAPGLRPYRTAISHHIPLVMLSNAAYTAYDRYNAAGWSHAISVTLLRTQLGFRGVTITDSLSGAAAARHVSPTLLAYRAARAGTDMILVTGSEASTAATFNALLADARAGQISVSTLTASYNRILALKAGL